jgi:hypothetical protein
VKETNCKGPVCTRKTRRKPLVSQITQNKIYIRLDGTEENIQMARLDR